LVGAAQTIKAAQTMVDHGKSEKVKKKPGPEVKAAQTMVDPVKSEKVKKKPGPEGKEAKKPKDKEGAGIRKVKSAVKVEKGAA